MTGCRQMQEAVNVNEAGRLRPGRQAQGGRGQDEKRSVSGITGAEPSSGCQGEERWVRAQGGTSKAAWWAAPTHAGDAGLRARAAAPPETVTSKEMLGARKPSTAERFGSAQ